VNKPSLRWLQNRFTLYIPYYPGWETEYVIKHCAIDNGKCCGVEDYTTSCVIHELSLIYRTIITGDYEYF
jgi:hypothetical protein